MDPYPSSSEASDSYLPPFLLGPMIDKKNGPNVTACGVVLAIAIFP